MVCCVGWWEWWFWQAAVAQLWDAHPRPPALQCGRGEGRPALEDSHEGQQVQVSVLRSVSLA